MEIRQLGQSGLTVTPMGLGLAALGRPGYINLGHAADLDETYEVAAMEAHAHDVLDAAWAAGIRYYDAARSYGRAEQFLGSWLRARGIAPADVTVGSKWGYTYTADWQIDADVHEVKEHSLAVLRRQRGESDGMLGDQLDLYQIHSATLESGVLENDDVLDELARLRDGGLSVGLSVSGAKQAEVIERAIDVQRGGEMLFATVQATWNLLERSAGVALRRAHEAGMGVIIKEAVANGRLTARNDSPDFAEQRALLDAVTEELGTSIDALALAGVLARPWVSVVLSGAARVDHLQSNVRALEIDWSDALEARLSVLTETAGDYWAHRSSLAWN